MAEPTPSIELAVVGAGAAGLMAAITAAEGGARVVLFNSHAQPGLKILMSGGTRCNVTHSHVDAASFHGGSRNVVARVLREFPAGEARRWFAGIGVALKEEPGGKLFPVSDSARTVLDALLARCAALGVDVRGGVKVLGVTRPAGGFALDASFALDTSAGPRAARCLLLATGGLSFPKTGSDGGGYALARTLGHTLVEAIPALTPITLGGDLHARLMGVTLPAALTLWNGPRRVVTCAGSLLFTHFGLSGPAALDMSRHWLRAAPEGRRLTLHLLPGEDAAAVEAGRLPDRPALEAALLVAAREEPRATLQSWCAPRLPVRVIRELAAEAGVDHAQAFAQLSREARRAFLDAVTALPLAVTGTLGYRKAEVTAGGVPLSEVDPRTLESRVCPGLYLAGELLDVDGRLGGYNFQWAWSSGRVAGRAAGAKGLLARGG